jgi:hypothetical protein
MVPSNLGLDVHRCKNALIERIRAQVREIARCSAGGKHAIMAGVGKGAQSPAGSVRDHPARRRRIILENSQQLGAGRYEEMAMPSRSR